MSYPEKFGRPCWNRDQAEDVINNAVANVSNEKASLFLAAHTPIKRIKDTKVGAPVTEEEAFQSLFSRKGEIRAVVRGDSGSGKSHLIRWINLRSEFAADSKELGLHKFKIVMVQRGTGSLKAALNQIVSQLGNEFEQYIEEIRNSVDRFSAKTAREELIHELALEINSRWEERGTNEPLSKDLNALGDVLVSPGYKKWLSRSGGVVDQKITCLTDSSSQFENAKNIIFTVDEIKPHLGFLNNTNDAPKVHDFIEDLEYEDELAEKTVKVLNQALIEAQRELTGIKGEKLNNIFTAIRHKLHTQGKQLAVFIEDVSKASGGLDQDLFEAFEPKQGKDLCRMIAVLGMTYESWDNLPDNEYDRVNFHYDMGDNTNQWSMDPTEVSKFSARYLNAIRCNEQEINEMARNRFISDVSMSKCDECPHQAVCHETFGYEELEDNVKIGLFPFSRVSPQKLLKSLKLPRRADHLRSTPRGLLDYVLDWALIKCYNQFDRNIFPNAKGFEVIRPSLTYWTELENKYLGGSLWSSNSNRERVKFLAEFWFDAKSSGEATSCLIHYQKPLSFPDFSSEPITTKTPEKVSQTETRTDPNEIFTEDREMVNLLSIIDEWSRGGKLSSDSKFRDLLSNFINKALRWQDYRGVPIKFAKYATKGTKPIRIEKQISRPSTQKYFLDFKCDPETRDLLEALLRYDREGKKSWNFNNGELHKRKAYRWLRKNRQRIINSLKPQPASLANDAISAASHLLGLTAILRNHSPLPKKEPQKRISEIFMPIWDETKRPQTLSKTLGVLVYNLEDKYHDAKELIISELGIGQGTATPKDFINPLPILEALENFEDKLIVKTPPKEIDDSFWQVRFGAVSKLEPYANLSSALVEEKNMIKRYFEDCKAFLSDAGFDTDDIKKDLVSCVKNVIELAEIEKATLKYYNELFDGLWKSKRLEDNRDRWSVSIDRAKKLILSSDDIHILCYDSMYLKEARNDLFIITKTHLQRVEEELTGQESAVTGDQGSTKDEFLAELVKIVKMLEKE